MKECSVDTCQLCLPIEDIESLVVTDYPPKVKKKESKEQSKRVTLSLIDKKTLSWQ